LHGELVEITFARSVWNVRDAWTRGCVDATYVSRSEKMPSGKVEGRSSAMVYAVFCSHVVEERARSEIGGVAGALSSLSIVTSGGAAQV
jgi:hypothetical protein